MFIIAATIGVISRSPDHLSLEKVAFTIFKIWMFLLFLYGVFSIFSCPVNPLIEFLVYSFVVVAMTVCGMTVSNSLMNRFFPEYYKRYIKQDTDSQ